MTCPNTIDETTLEMFLIGGSLQGNFSALPSDIHGVENALLSGL